MRKSCRPVSFHSEIMLGAFVHHTNKRVRQTDTDRSWLLLVGDLYKAPNSNSQNKHVGTQKHKCHICLALQLWCCAVLFQLMGRVYSDQPLHFFPGGTLNLCALTFKDTGFGCCCNDFCCRPSACSNSSKELCTSYLFSSPAEGVKQAKPQWGEERPALD